MAKSRRTKKGNKGKFNYKRERETKNNPFFWSPNKGLWEEEEEEGEEEEQRGKSSQGMDLWSLSMELYDFGRIFVHKLLGYGLLGFSLEIKLAPFSRVLLGIHPNSRFKGS